MAFQPVDIRQGRRPDRNCVTAGRSAEYTIWIALSADLAQQMRLRAAGHVKIEYGTGADIGWIRVTRARATDAGITPLHQNGAKLYVNINRRFLLDAKVPTESITLPHRWSGESLLIDIRPLSPTKYSTRSQSSDRALTLP